MMKTLRRKTRFVCVSDTHGYSPSEAGFKLPAGDVLIHAGDLTNQGSMSELRKTINWIAAADYEVKIIICGNHDVTLDPDFYAEHGAAFHNQSPEDPEKCIEFVTTASSSILFLRHQSALVRLTRPNGPNTIFKVFGSPYSQFEGTWAFGYETENADALWSQVPLDADIVVTHMPPYSHCDRLAAGTPIGCKSLRQRLSRVRPPLAVCGHVHYSRGYERVQWPLPARSIPCVEEPVVRGVLPPRGSKKQSLVDLTGKRGLRLKNEGFSINNGPSYITAFLELPQKSIILLPVNNRAPLSEREVTNESAPCILPSYPTESQSADQEWRSLRQETCIVNAAIVATNWPHSGGRKFNTPIVVDLELPVWSAPCVEQRGEEAERV